MTEMIPFLTDSVFLSTLYRPSILCEPSYVPTIGIPQEMVSNKVKFG